MLCFASEISHSLYSVSSFNPQLKGHFPREALLILHRLMGASLVAQLVKNPPAMQETTVRFLVGKIPWKRNRLPTPVFLGFPGGSAGKESACNVSRPGFDPWVGKIPWSRGRLLTTVFWPREFHGLYSPWGRKESDMTKQLLLSLLLT